MIGWWLGRRPRAGRSPLVADAADFQPRVHSGPEHANPHRGGGDAAAPLQVDADAPTRPVPAAPPLVRKSRPEEARHQVPPLRVQPGELSSLTWPIAEHEVLERLAAATERYGPYEAAKRLFGRWP